MSWISVKDMLPDQGEYCWIYGDLHGDGNPFILEGHYDQDSIDLRSSPLKHSYGWEYDVDQSNYIMLDQVSHWMPYYTPEPPK